MLTQSRVFTSKQEQEGSDLSAAAADHTTTNGRTLSAALGTVSPHKRHSDDTAAYIDNQHSTAGYPPTTHSATSRGDRLRTAINRNKTVLEGTCARIKLLPISLLFVCLLFFPVFGNIYMDTDTSLL